MSYYILLEYIVEFKINANEDYVRETIRRNLLIAYGKINHQWWRYPSVISFHSDCRNLRKDSRNQATVVGDFIEIFADDKRDKYFQVVSTFKYYDYIILHKLDLIL